MPDATVLPTYEPEVVDDVLKRIRRARSSMPYGALVHSREIESLGDVVDYLLALRDVLATVAADNEAKRLELDELRSQRRAVREFLGTDK